MPYVTASGYRAGGENDPELDVDIVVGALYHY
jgi:hypothetical protein